MEKELLNSRSRADWENLIYQWIHSERDRWILSRKLLDGITYDELTSEYQKRYKNAPLEYTQVRKRHKDAEKQLLAHVNDQ